MVISSLLCACTTVTYPNGTTVTTPYVAPVAYGGYYPGYYANPYGTYGVYGGGYFPVYGGNYGYSCWNRPYWNNCNGGWNGWGRWNGGTCGNGGGYRAWSAPVGGSYASAGWNGYRAR